MSNPAAVFFADAHLDPVIWSSRPQIRGDSFQAFSQIVNFAIEVRAGCLVGAGDLIDVKRPPPEVVEFLRKQMDLLAAAEIDFYYVEGQHERADPPWLAAVHDWPINLHGKLITVPGGHRMYGISWTPPDRLPEELAKIPEHTSILVCHQVWEEFMGDITSPEGSLTSIPHARLVFTGDYHKTLHRQYEGASKQPLLVYSPGATHLRAINEPFEHRIAVMYPDGKVKWRKIPGRYVIEKSITSTLDLEVFISEWKDFYKQLTRPLPEELQLPILKIRYQASMPEVRRRIQEVYGSLAHLFWDPYIPETPERAQARVISQELRAKGPAGCLETVVPKTDPNYAPLLRLIQAEDPSAELLALKAERGL